MDPNDGFPHLSAVRRWALGAILLTLTASCGRKHTLQVQSGAAVEEEADGWCVIGDGLPETEHELPWNANYYDGKIVFTVVSPCDTEPPLEVRQYDVDAWYGMNLDISLEANKPVVIAGDNKGAQRARFELRTTCGGELAVGVYRCTIKR